MTIQKVERFKIRCDDKNCRKVLRDYFGQPALFFSPDSAEREALSSGWRRSNSGDSILCEDCAREAGRE